MKSKFNFYFVIVLSAMGLTQCQDDFEAVSNVEKQEIASLSANTNEVDEGVTYLNQQFFLKSLDSKSAGMTRSSGEGLLTRNFFINQSAEGDSYLGVHILPASIGKNQLQNVLVYVNDEEVGELEITKDQWEFVTLKDQRTISLKSGSNKISFVSEAPFYPEIDAIQIEASANRLMKKDPQYEDFIKHLKYSTSGAPGIKLEQDEVDAELREIANIQTRSAINPGDWNWQVTPQTFNNPDGNYAHRMNVPITYTYHRKLSLSAGTYTFHTATYEGETNSVDPFMYLYKVDDPHNYSYYNDDGAGNFHSKITVNIPAGDYYLVIRAYSSAFSSTTTGRQGLIDVYQNGTRINSGSPIAGYMVDVDTPYTGTMNFFTAYSSGIPDFYLEEKSTRQLKFFGETMFYMEPMDFMWWDDARLQMRKSSDARYNMLVSSVGAFGAYYGNCDVYGMVPNAIRGDGWGVLESFPNLKQADAMYSGLRSTNVYNCASWAGGMTSGWTWGGIYNSQSGGVLIGHYYGSPYVWDTWDNFFGNNPSRYAGATTYTRDQADSSNGVIAVWSTNGSISGATHFSVRGTANNHPHGYAWESKPGALIRTFHPRDALNGNSYGQIIGYYRDASKEPYQSVTRSLSTSEDNISFEESLEKGLTVIEEVELLPEHKSMLTVKTRSASAKTNSIQNLYNKWRDKCNSAEFRILSNPFKFLETTEAEELINYCKNNKDEALLFFTNLYFIDQDNDAPKQISYSIFCEVFYENAELMEDVKKRWSENKYNDKGAYIAPLPETFGKKYVKALFERKFK